MQSSTLFTNIRWLAGCASNPAVLRGKHLANLEVIEDAFLLVENNRVASFGSMLALSAEVREAAGLVCDVRGKAMLPAWCDSHTHIVFAKSREEEFVQKIQGVSYAEIAASGGGILNSAAALANTSEDELYEHAAQRLRQMAALGTGAAEIKSGYGLTIEGELKMLRVIKRLKQGSPVTIISTFLGAHAFPAMYKEDHAGYIRLLTEEMLPAIASEDLADYIDVFCETGFFSVAEMETICNAGAKFGLKPKLHVNQLNSIGGIQAAIKLDAISVDHLEVMTGPDIEALANAPTIATLLPGAAFFLRMPYQPAREIIDAGAAVALATDYNPGSCPSGNMNLVLALACIQMKMLPAEAINACTINGAAAMESEAELGSITVGKKANLIITKAIPSLAYLPYAFGEVLVERVMLEGKFVS